MAEIDTKTLTVNWNRAIFIDEEITDDLAKRLAPSILKLRQENDEPITIGINSPGGSLDSLDTLLGLLTGPNQTSKKGKIITVATNSAYSAAANFLAFGDYSIALKHANILYHDVRFSGLRDVTPEKALSAAKSLKEANDSFSLRLANKIVQRLVWVYLDLHKDFEDINKKYSKLFEKYDNAVKSYTPTKGEKQIVDLASFATCLYAKLSVNNDGLIKNVMDRLSRWILLTNLATATPAYKLKGSRVNGLLDGLSHLHKNLNGKTDNFQSSEGDLKLFLTLLIGEIATPNSAGNSFHVNLETATRDFTIMQSMNDKKHRSSAIRLMVEYEMVFFPGIDLEKLSDEEQLATFEKAMHCAQLFWLFCALLCRELFEGEHILQPNDAQLLGLVDEVSGGGPVESPRDFRIKKNKEEQETPPTSEKPGSE